MRAHSVIVSFALPLAISWLVWGVPSQAAAEEAEVQETEAGAAEGKAPAKAKRRGMRRRQPRAADPLQEIWWNDPAVVEHLSLSEAARSEMDGYYKAHLGAIEKHGNRDLRTAFADALRDGDWDKARKLLDEQAAEAGGFMKAQGEIKVRVLSLLSEEQRAKLLKKQPNLLRQMWSPKRLAGPETGKPPRRRAKE